MRRKYIMSQEDIYAANNINKWNCPKGEICAKQLFISSLGNVN